MLRIADKVFDSHLFTGTGKFASPQLMVDAIRESGSQLVTLALKRVDLRHHSDAILAPLLEAGVTLLPNTSGAKTAEEAIFAAQLAREALGTRWLKLEIHPDARWLLPDPIETLKAAEKLVQQGSSFCLTAVPIRYSANVWKTLAAPPLCRWARLLVQPGAGNPGNAGDHH